MILEVLSNYINNSLEKNNIEARIHVIISNRRDLCDYQIDDCFRLAKSLHTSPISIGEEIVECICNNEDFDDYFEKIEVVKPGFINITIADKLLCKTLRNMMGADKFGIKMPDKADTYVLDYGGPNVAKPLHVGHMRTAIVGESIRRIISYMGHKTISDVHLGDYGLQIGQVIYGILEDKVKDEDITLEYLEEVYPRISALSKEDALVKEKCATITRELQDGNPLYQRLWKIILKISSDDIRRLYKYLGVHFDIWQGESDAYNYIGAVEEILNDKNLLLDSEGAKVIDVSKSDDPKEIPPVIFKKSNGAYLYATTDIATIYEREMKYHPDHILYVVDNRQKLHFEQVFRAVKKADITDAKLEFLGYGTVNGIDGKPFKTRNGDAPKLDSLFNEIKEIFCNMKDSNSDMPEEDVDKVVNSILKFADLQNNRDRDYIFDIEKFSNVIGKTGPYILYTYVRINKIISEYKNDHTLSDYVYNESDRNLRLKLIELDLSLQSAFVNRMPSYIADYIYNIAVLANNFYQTNHINGLDDIMKKNDWLFILSLTNKILKEMLNLIIIETPSFM